MGYTKRQYVQAAFDEIGYASYEFDLSSEVLEAGMRRLDAMMAEWNAKGIRLGYPLPVNPADSDLDEQTYVPDSANEAIIANLAIRLAPGRGKTVSMETRYAAKLAYDAILSRATFPPEMQIPSTMPMGAGNKGYSTDVIFFPTPTDPLLAGGDSEITYD